MNKYKIYKDVLNEMKCGHCWGKGEIPYTLPNKEMAPCKLCLGDGFFTCNIDEEFVFKLFNKFMK